MTVGLGTGSTAHFFIQKLGQMVQQGLQIQGVPTSVETENKAHSWGIPILSIGEVKQIDIVVDGADEVDQNFQLIKGGGGALYREKMVASLTKQMIVVAEAGKYVETLGQFPLPVEVVPFGHEVMMRRLSAIGLNPHLRMQGDSPKPYRTDNGNYIFDCRVGRINHPAELHQRVKGMVGVVETGLFIDTATQVILAHPNGHVEVLAKQN